MRATLRPRREADDGPLVTVVVAVGPDSAAHVDEGLQAVRDQTHRRLEIVAAPLTGADAAMTRVLEHARADVRMRVLRAGSDPAAVRNHAAARARGEFLVFVDVTDVLPRHAVSALLAPAARTGSDLVIGRRTEIRGFGRSVVRPPDPLHDEPRTATTLGDCPVAVTDLGAENRLYRRSFWSSAGLAFHRDDRSDAELALDATARAGKFDVIGEVTYLSMNRAVAAPVGRLPDHMDDLDGWLTDQQDKRRKVSALEIAVLRDHWAYAALNDWVQPFLDDAERASAEQWERLRTYVDELDAEMSPGVWVQIGAESRVKLWLLRNDRREQLAEYQSERWFEQGNRPTRVVDGVVHAELPFYGDEAVGIPAETYVMQPAETPLVTVLREVTWDLPERIDLVLFSWIDFVGHGDDEPEVEVALVHEDTGERTTLAVERFDSPQVTHAAGHRYQDYRKGGLRVGIDAAALVAGAGTESARWRLDLAVRYRGLERRGGVTRKDPRGSADLLGTRLLAPRRVGDALVCLDTSTADTFQVSVRSLPPVSLRAAASRRRGVSGTLGVDAGVEITSVVLTPADGNAVQAPVQRVADGLDFAADLPRSPRMPPGHAWQLEALDATGTRQPVLWLDQADPWLPRAARSSLAWARDAAGGVEVVEATGTLVVVDVRLGPGELEVTGHWLGEAPRDYRLELVTSRTTLVAEPVAGADAGHVALRFPLTWDEWGHGATPVPLARYAFALSYGPRSAPGRVLYGATMHDTLDFQLDDTYLLRPFRAAGEVGVVLSRPLDADERGPYQQKQLQQWLLTGEEPLDPDAVYLQSYAGASATDSQLAIHHELRRTHPHLTLHWGIADRSCRVPEGGVPVLLNSREWYAALARSTYLVTNIDFDRWFTKRPGQKLLQTFHGYPSKSMGIRLWQAKQFPPRRIDAEVGRTSASWDLALTPTPEMDEHYRREYRYEGRIFSHGYPRDDVLVSPDADRIREETRARLGIAPGQTAVLYAPTWRDDLATNYRSAQMAKHLDVESASRELGDDFVMLMRGHRFHARAGHHEGRSTRMVDVTTYPEINDLILAADAAVLDYSSLRFDFALTGRPMLFLVPDLATYTGAVRGFLFDFASSAPGPLLDSADEVIASLRDLERVSARYAGARDAFHAQFNYLQDGNSAEAVVREFFTPAP